MTKDQKIVAAGAAAGAVAMLAGLAALSSAFTGIAAEAGAGERLGYAARWIAVAALPLVVAIASVGNGRFHSEAIDPTAGQELAEMVVNGRVVDNTVQQFLLFSVASLAFAGAARGDQLDVLAAAALVFVAARLAFWIGYRVHPLYRACGFAATFYLNILLLGAAFWLADWS